MSVIAQYDGQLLALKVERRLASQAERDAMKKKNLETFILSQMSRNQTQRTTSGGAYSRQSKFMSQSLEDLDPFKKRNNEYTFGEKLCTNHEFLAKSILLSKNGMKVYFLKRDHNQKSDIIMSVELLPTRPDSDGTTIEVQIRKVFESVDARIIYFSFDHMIE